MYRPFQRWVNKIIFTWIWIYNFRIRFFLNFACFCSIASTNGFGDKNNDKNIKTMNPRLVEANKRDSITLMVAKQEEKVTLVKCDNSSKYIFCATNLNSSIRTVSASHF